MEAKFNLLIFFGILAVTAGLSADDPAPSLDPADPSTQALAELEDAYARSPNDRHLARRLAEAYLDLQQPGLVVAVLRAGDASLMEDPIVAHRMAQAYEATGRVLDAAATADYARNVCTRLAHAGARGEAGVETPTCTFRELAVIDVHARVLQRLVAWGVSDPLRDPRTTQAYQMEMRVARIAWATPQ